jgi:hypothetical protein
MKRIIYIASLVVLISAASCKKYVTGYELSPNNPSDAPLSMILPQVELSTFVTYNSGLNRNASMWTQQNHGNQFQSADQGTTYSLNENDIINEWRTLYSEGLKNCKIIEKKAGDKNPYYLGISQMMSALLLGAATDFWGDVPYSQAFKGEDLEFSAAYDAQQDVLNTIQSLCDKAIANFSKAAGDNVYLPSSDDFVFQGDPDKWKAAAWLLKARYHNRLSKIAPGTSADDVLNDIAQAKASGFTSNASNAYAMYGTNSNEYNQWYAFAKVERQGYIVASKFFIDTLVATNDPRLPFYFTKNDSSKYEGCANGETGASNKSEIGDFYASPDSKQPLLTYSELLFLEAEANFRKGTGNAAAAATAHNAAVKANLSFVTGANDTGYVNAFANENAGSITLNKIMWQKYISNFTQIEVFNDWRRTNIPALTPSTASNLGAIPRRYPTSVEERQYNTKATVVADLLKRVWWDN